MATDRRTVLTRAGVRVLAGAAGLAASAVVALAAFTLPLPSAHAQPASRTVTPVPASASVACPGGLLSLGAGGSAGSTAALTLLGESTVVSGGGSGTPSAVALKAVDASGSSPQAFELPAKGAGAEPLLAAAESTSVRTEEVRGLAAANCAQPDFEQWLVGGATSLGATTLVVLGNPGDVAATVEIDAYSEQGLAEAAGGKGILVQPHTQQVVPLSGLVPNATATVVRVTSTGGTVSAQLQESEISGVTPQGAEWIGPGASPAKKLVIPGAVVDTTGIKGATATDDGDGGVPVLRVLPAGTKDAKLTIGVKADKGGSGGTATTSTVSHGVVSEIPLEHLGNGTYTVTVESTEPVVAAVHTGTVDAKTGSDFAWYAAAPALSGAVALPVAPGPAATLHLANTSGAAVTVKLAGPGGGSIAVPAGASISRGLKSSGVLTTSDAQGLYASISYKTKGQLAAYVVYPTSTSASALTVYKR
ncbi:DUF5719 family protein [Gryllotalpicola koreensis]|uniref:Uncharacterized protein n=1 Tax=Gryllotalpicola koreensis TaxID=993086 RepID=A0ABP8A1S0_9MICO